MIGEKLWIERGDGAAVAHRVVPSGPPRRARVGDRVRHAVEVRDGNSARGAGHGSPGAATFPRLVPLGELTDAAPLTAADEAEYARLDAALAGTHGDARLLRRFNALRLRWLLFGSEASA